MKNMILAAIAALSLSAIAPVAQAATFGAAQSSVHQGPYDNTANSLGGGFVGGGD